MSADHTNCNSSTIGNWCYDCWTTLTAPETVNHPVHYGGVDDPYEVIKVLEAWRLTSDAYLFNVVKYIARHEQKGTPLQDLEKARWYLDRKIKVMKGHE
jgi:hypothetical protein